MYPYREERAAAENFFRLRIRGPKTAGNGGSGTLFQERRLIFIFAGKIIISTEMEGFYEDNI
jgi:hypothetical protein